MRTESPEAALAEFEGLVTKTAKIIEDLVDEDFDDIRQILRLKVWIALNSFDPERSRQTRSAFVFSCVMNQKKDILKRTRNQRRIQGRGDLMIEDLVESHDSLARLRFEARYMSEEPDSVFADVELDAPMLPNTLSRLERQIVLRLYAGYTESEIARQLGIRRTRVVELVDTIKVKLGDWKPDARTRAYAEAA